MLQHYPTPPLLTRFSKSACEVRRDDEAIKLESPRLEHFIAQEVFGGEYPIPHNAAHFLKGLPVVDIGGHVGFTVAYWWLMLRPSRIHVYEPNPRALEYLGTNVRHIPNTTVFAEAVAGHTGTCEFADHQCLGMGSMIEKPWEVVARPVPCIHIREALDRIEGDIGVLKVDAEEAEGVIFPAAGDALKRVRVVYLEHHGEDLRRDVDDIMRSLGFYLFHGEYIWTRGVSGYVHPDYALCLYDDDDLKHHLPADAPEGESQPAVYI